MSKYFQEGETVRITFEDGSWVDIKQELTQEDQDYIVDHMARAENVAGAAKVEMSLGRMALLERSIVAWSFEAPVDKQHISALRQVYRAEVLKKVDSLYQQASNYVSKNA